MLMLGRKPVSPLCMPYAGFEKATNCILEIPQNIKLTLENNVLTLKAGSILTLTGTTYATITTTVDRVKSNFSLNPNSIYIMFTANNGVSFAWKKIEKVGSGESLPADNTNYDNFFLTTDKIIYIWSGESWSYSDITYPICLIQTDENGNLSFVKDSNGNDMIFNGAGFIGHHVFVYPNVKTLTSNGFNDDKTLANSLIVTNSLNIVELSSNRDTLSIYSNSTIASRNYLGEFNSYNDLPVPIGGLNIAYVINDNSFYFYSNNVWESMKGHYTNIVHFSINNNIVTDFTIKQPLTIYRWVVKLIP